MRTALLPAALVLTIAVPAPCAAQHTRTGGTGDQSGTHEYVIGPGDVLEVAVWDNTAISRTVPVRPDGKISLPLVHDVQVAGLTPMQLSEVLNTALARYMETPAVAVIVREIHSFTVSVIGQVKTPGRFELAGPTTVLDVLAMAGGLTEFADRGRIVILRREGGTARRIPFAYNKLLSRDGSNGGQENLLLQRDDIVMVP